MKDKLINKQIIQWLKVLKTHDVSKFKELAKVR